MWGAGLVLWLRGNSEERPSATGDFCCLLWTLWYLIMQGQKVL